MKTKLTPTRPGYARYSEPTNERAVDPTPAEIQERIIEVMQMRERKAILDRIETVARHDALVAWLRDHEGIPTQRAAVVFYQSIGFGLQILVHDLASLEQSGVIQRIGAGCRSSIRLLSQSDRTADTFCDDLPSNEAVFARFCSAA